MTTKATRHPKTPAQRAQETVDILQRRLVKIATQKAALEAHAGDLATVLVIVQKRLTYAEANPDLPPAKQAKRPELAATINALSPRPTGSP